MYLMSQSAHRMIRRGLMVDDSNMKLTLFNWAEVIIKDDFLALDILAE